MSPDDVAALEAKIKGLHDLMETKFNHIQERLQDVKSALEKLSLSAITEQAYQEQIRRMEGIARRQDEQEKRLDRLEGPMRIIKIVGTVVGAIIVAVLVALATGKAHIEWH